MFAKQTIFCYIHYDWVGLTYIFSSKNSLLSDIDELVQGYSHLQLKLSLCCNWKTWMVHDLTVKTTVGWHCSHRRSYRKWNPIITYVWHPAEFRSQISRVVQRQCRAKFCSSRQYRYICKLLQKLMNLVDVHNCQHLCKFSGQSLTPKVNYKNADIFRNVLQIIGPW